MLRFNVIGLVVVLFAGCNSINLQEVCKGEWSYFVNDTSYCEILISEGMVFPYHNNALNSYSYKYKIEQDTFYIYGNTEGVIESSPINYLGRDSFQILAITPSTLKRIKKTEHSLANYHYKRELLLKDKNINTLIAERVFVEMDDLKKAFDKEYQERRRTAIYRKNKRKIKN